MDNVSLLNCIHLWLYLTHLLVRFHIPLFLSILTLSSGNSFLLRNGIVNPDDQADNSEQIPEEELPAYIHQAIWIVACSLAVSMLSMTGIALLDKSFDAPGTLRIDNCNVRLLGRLLYIVIVVLIPVKRRINLEVFLCVCSILLMALVLWEWIVSTEKGANIVEPRRKSDDSGEMGNLSVGEVENMLR